MRSVCVFGAGPAGLSAAISAARAGAAVRLIEKTDCIGKKLSMTGNGRCNLTNLDPDPDNYNESAAETVRRLSGIWGPGETAAFMRSVGVLTRAEGRQVYPRSGQAVSVVSALKNELDRLGVRMIFNEQLKDITAKAEGGFSCRTQGAVYEADAVVAATGGLSGPKTCRATGDAYYICDKLGLKLIDRQPALVPLMADDGGKFDGTGVRTLAGIDFTADGRSFQREKGEIQFAAGTISGIPVLQASGRAARLMSRGAKVEAVVDLLDGIDDAEWEIIRKSVEECADSDDLERRLRGFINDLLAEAVTDAVSGNKRTGAVLTGHDRAAVLEMLRGYRLRITGAGDYTRAQATSGGVSLDEIDDSFMAVKIPGLYIAGELLDADGRCGGFNLQWAFMSGAIAGFGAAAGRDVTGEDIKVITDGQGPVEMTCGSPSFRQSFERQSR